MQSGIYLIKCLANGKIYVGSAVNLKKRSWEHFYRLKKNEHHNEYLQRAYNKYGHDAFQFIQIEICDKDKLIEKEQFYIDWFKATDENIGYNLCKISRSNLGRKFTEEHKQKLSISNRKPKHSEEHKANLSAMYKGKRIGKNAKLGELKLELKTQHFLK